MPYRLPGTLARAQSDGRSAGDGSRRDPLQPGSHDHAGGDRRSGVSAVMQKARLKAGSSNLVASLATLTGRSTRSDGRSYRAAVETLHTVQGILRPAASGVKK